MDFGVLPPEINSGPDVRGIRGGDPAGRFRGWDALAAEFTLSRAATKR